MTARILALAAIQIAALALFTVSLSHRSQPQPWPQETVSAPY